MAEAAALDIEEVATSSLTLNAYKYNSLIKVSSELLQDSAFNLEAELGMFLGEPKKYCPITWIESGFLKEVALTPIQMAIYPVMLFQ